MKIYLAGRNGLLGTAFCRYYRKLGGDFLSTSSAEVDLRDKSQVDAFLRLHRPDVVILSAAKHGGIENYSRFPLEYYRDNLLISTNVINAAAENGVGTLINIGASCVYAENLPGPLREEQLYDGPVQKATEPYGLAKAAGMKLCEYYNRCGSLRYLSLLPVNLYGNGVGYKPDLSSVLPSMMRRFHEAVAEGKSSVSIWGSGNARREFLHAEDLVRAADLVINSHFSEPYINVGSSKMYTINQIAEISAKIAGFSGKITHDLSKPEGAQREMLDCSRLNALGWAPKVDLYDGLSELYRNLYAN